MHGNVKEWCEDQQLAHNLKHMYFVRGGNFSQKADASSVDAFNYAKAFHDLGLRVARVPRSAFRVRKLVVFNLGMEFRKVPGGKSWLGGESGNPGPRSTHSLRLLPGHLRGHPGRMATVHGQQPQRPRP